MFKYVCEKLRKFYKGENPKKSMVFERKKGLSPVIATVLLIALAMVLAMIIFIWARGWISEQIEKKGTPIDQICESVSMRVELYPIGGSDYDLSISNDGSVSIHAIEIRAESKGSSETFTREISLNEMGSTIKRITLKSGTERIIVYPQLLGTIKGKTDHREKTCLDEGKIITLNS
jgi:flagellin-like protein